jgi:hypothetical protein
MALDPRIEAVRVQYGLEQSDFWQIPQNKQWVCKHAALEIVATKANVLWSPPQIIQADTVNGIAVLAVTGQMGDRIEWATGEASPKNNKNSYPWAMAEKRAKDRVVLKLAGIHGLVYSEDEMPPEVDTRGKAAPDDKPKPISAAEQKRGLEAIEADLLDCHTIADVNKCAKIWASIMDRDGWSKAYRDTAIPKFATRRTALTVNDEIPDFPGDRPNGAIANMMAG